MTDPMEHNYMKKIMALVRSGKLEGCVLQDLQVAHDDWCGIHGGGVCNCDPDVFDAAMKGEQDEPLQDV